MPQSNDDKSATGTGKEGVDGGAAKCDAALAPEAQDAITSQLKRLYGDMLKAPIPDRFSELLADLSKGKRSS